MTTNYTYEERMAIILIRKSMIKKPDIITEIMKDAALQHANAVLLLATTDLEQLLVVNRAFIAAAKTLVEHQKESSC